MLVALLGDVQDMIPLKRLIIDETEGTPFFMEEIVQALFDDGALLRNGAVKLTKPLNALKIPPTVQGILAARIDRLPPMAKELAANARRDRPRIPAVADWSGGDEIG